MISAHAVTCPFLGRRWKARCERCRIDLPGRYTSRGDAERAGVTHLELRHAGLGVSV